MAAAFPNPTVKISWNWKRRQTHLKDILAWRLLVGKVLEESVGGSGKLSSRGCSPVVAANHWSCPFRVSPLYVCWVSGQNHGRLEATILSRGYEVLDKNKVSFLLLHSQNYVMIKNNFKLNIWCRNADCLHNSIKFNLNKFVKVSF